MNNQLIFVKEIEFGFEFYRPKNKKAKKMTSFFPHITGYENCMTSTQIRMLKSMNYEIEVIK